MLQFVIHKQAAADVSRVGKTVVCQRARTLATGGALRGNNLRLRRGMAAGTCSSAFTQRVHSFDFNEPLTFFSC